MSLKFRKKHNSNAAEKIAENLKKKKKEMKKKK